MKIRIDMEATEAASLASALVSHGGLGARLTAATREVERILETEEARTDELLECFGRLEGGESFDWDVGGGESSEGELLSCALEGEIECELHALLGTRRDAKVFGDLLLDAVALLLSLELTEVRVKIGGRRASLQALSDAVVRLAGEHSVFLTPASERNVRDDVDAEDDEGLDDEDDDGIDGDDEGEDLDGEDDEGVVEDDGIPPGGWGACQPATRHPTLSPEEIFYLEVAQLSWPCAPEAVRAGVRRVARYHPDLAEHDPALRAVRHEQFIRLNRGRDALLTRLEAR